MKLSAGFAVLVALLSACGGAEDPPPSSSPTTESRATATFTATPEDPLLAPTYDLTIENPFVINGPYQPDTALDRPLHSSFMLDLMTGEVFSIETDPNRLHVPRSASGASGGALTVAWESEDVLNIALNGQQYSMSLAGLEVAGPTPVGEQPSGIRRGGTSPSGRWSAGMLGSGAGGVALDHAEGEQGPDWHVSASGLPVWAPTADLLAMQGNLCAYDVLLLDLSSLELKDLTPNLPTAPYFSWDPDSTRLAVFSTDGAAIEIHLLTVRTAEQTLVFRAERGGTVIPGAWSPDSRRLLFNFYPTPFVPCTTDWGGPSQVDQNFGGP